MQFNIVFSFVSYNDLVAYLINLEQTSYNIIIYLSQFKGGVEDHKFSNAIDIWVDWAA